MHSFMARAVRSVGLGLATSWLAFAAGPRTVLPGVQPDGSVLLPNQWSLRPVGKQLPVGDFPSNLALHPGGVFAAVLHCGYGPHEVRVLDVQTGRSLSQEEIDESFYGLAWSPDGRQLFVSGGGAEVIHAFDFQDGYLSAHRELALRPVAEQGVPSGLAVSADGRSLYVAESWGQRVVKVAAADGRMQWTRSLAAAAGAATTQHEGARLNPALDPQAPFPYTCVPDEAHGRVFVSLWAASAVLVLDARTGAELGRWPVGRRKLKGQPTPSPTRRLPRRR